MSDLSQRLAALSPEKRALLLKKLEQQRAHKAEKEPPAIHQQSREQSFFPLSFAQRRLWFLEQLEPGRGLYHLALPFEARQGLDIALLQRCLDLLAQRHESLRTVFVMRGDEPYQHLLPAIAIPLIIDDLSMPTLPDARNEAEARLARSLREPFDFTQGPLIRTRLIRLPGDYNLGCIYLHHLIADGWSLTILWREFVELYTALQAGQEIQLTPIDLQYVDYAAWQREYLQGERLESQLAYWRQHLQGAPALLTLPTDHQRPPRQTFEGRHLNWELSSTVDAQLHALGRREQVTPFMILLAAFQVLLARYCGQKDLVVGTPIAGRVRPEIEPIIGFFANTLALRTRMAGISSFVELVRQVRETTLEAYAHQDIPFEYLVEALHPSRDLGASPIFQVMFVLQTLPAPDAGNAHLNLAPLALESQVAKFDLTCTVVETRGGLHGTFEYNSTLFEAGTIQRLARHWCLLVSRLLADPAQDIWRVSFLTPEEREHLLFTWNTGPAMATAGVSVPALFEEQARHTPLAQAIVWEEGTLSYAELDRRTNQLAQHLRARNVGPETLVALCLDRSPEMLIAQLAVLKAGGAYVPLDPAYPPARLALLLEDCAAPIVLTLERYLSQLPAGQTDILCLDRDAELLTQEEGSLLGLKVNPETLAYLIYTSGSTGLPKGTMVTHRSLVGRVLGFITLYQLNTRTRQLQFASPGFDISVEEILSPLCSGGAVVLYGNPQERTGLELLQFCRRFEVSKINIPASYWHQVVDEVTAACETLPPSLQISVTGGEKPLLEKLVLWQRAAHHPLRFFNVYGPTEGTILATHCELPLDQVDCTKLPFLPLGRPFFNTRLYVLDAHQQLVPPGVSGELYLGGEGVTRGYLKRPDVTAERFVPDPFSERGGDRLYRTGDLVRYHPDGSLEFLGRADHQVKIRGFRIELGEIEAALAQHPHVQQCAVMVREDTPGECRLVAYVIPNERPDTPDERQEAHEQAAVTWRRFLQQWLPAYMLPSAFVILPSFPLTPHQKVDYRALPAPEASAPGDERFYQAPRTPEEARLAQLWQEVLCREQIGIDENFFEVGGHSLLATSLIARTQELFQVAIPLRTLFEHPSIQEMAREIERLRAQVAEMSMPLLVSRVRGSEIPLSFAQQRLWFLAQLDVHSFAYNLPVVLLWRNDLNRSILERTFEQLVLRHESLRTLFVDQDGQPIQVILPTLELPLHYQDYSRSGRKNAYEQALQWLRHESLRPFDLEHGPLFRVSLALLAPGEYLLGLCMHHSISDGWSLGILLREMLALYTAQQRGETLSLPPLPGQYADYALWQREWMQGERLQTQLRYWREHLADAPPLLALPTDHPRPTLQTFNGAVIHWTIPATLATRLRDLSRQEQVTLFMVLLAAFQVLLARYSGQDDLVVGTPIAGRTRVETEKILGFFVNTLPLRARLPAALSFRELLRQVRETALGAYAHQDIPFEQLVEALQPARHLSYSPLFQVMFAFQQAPLSEAELAQYALEPVPLESPVAKFDLTCAVIESEQALDGTFEYNTDLFEAATIERLGRHFHVLLAGIAANPDQSLLDLPLLTPEEQHTMLVEWNATQQPYPAQATLHQLLEEQVARTPGALAVSFEGQTLTYDELNRRANQLAHALRHAGVDVESRVGVCMERSLEMVIALLAVLKSGGAYVPLDPGYPQERLAYMLEDAQVPVLLTQTAVQAQLPHTDVVTICLDTFWDGGRDEPETNLQVALQPDNLAYMIYTSGSTGKPKGVMNTHRGIVNRLHWMQQTYQLTAADRVMQKTPFSFDVSVWEFFWPLLSGARLVVARPGGQQDTQYLASLIGEQHITTMHFVSSMLQAFLLEADLEERCHSLKRVFCSGEALPFDLQERFFARFPRVALHNLYGPTEAAIEVTYWECQHGSQETTVPIGRPIANTQIYLLDAALHPVPIGVPGELYIGGVGVARGYFRRPELTREKFIADPFSDQAGARLFKTGDLARYRADGAIEFLGRIDHQVKIRGFRIELEEIEAVLAQHPAAKEVVVTAREDTPGNKRLVAYIVPAAGAATAQTAMLSPQEAGVSVEDLRAFLKEHIPAYMVPANILLLPALPHTSSGKIERRALPDPESITTTADAEANRRLPRTELEQALARLWCEVLDRREVGIEENFFDLGAHSLLLVRLHSLLRSRLQLDFTLLELFQYPTIQALVEYVQRKAGGEAAVASQGLAQSAQRARDRRETLDQQRQRRRQQHQQARRLSGGKQSE